ncbi:MAG TPA: LLM class flavin-dependent oxidoreductase [Stellaceae bacterium]|nr:LLM class flavin-dependent oxidoreductase [Stellaceae bacterium]
MAQLHYDEPLRFGLFLAPFHSAKLDPTYAFERDLLLAEHLDRIGFDELWFGEHHSGAMEMIAAPELMVAAAAQRTKYIRLGTGVKSLPFHNPFMLAEAMAQLDHMTRGRAMFGVGPGALPTDVHMLGIEMKDIRHRMDESLDTIVALMKGETVTLKTEWYHLREARLHVGCYRKPMMELAVTSVRSPAGVAAAGRHGLGVLTLGPTTDAALLHHVENWGIHEAECKKHGHVADRAKWRVTLVMHIAETRAQAFADTEFGFPEWIDYTHDVIPAVAAFPRGVPNPAQFCNDHQLGIIGTPDDAIREIERIRNTLGGMGAVLVFGNDLAPWPAQRRSFELLAEFVKPHFSKVNAARRASYQWAAENQNENRQKGQSAVAAATEEFARRQASGRGD